MISIQSIEWRNFLGYGDYITKIENLDSLGPVLVTGSLEDEKERSNGAGKSSIISAIVWCLFGRTVKRANPGDNIINFSVGRDCIVEIKTTDGWTIRRTRKAKGHDDLLVYHGDKDESRGTNKDAQKFILKHFNLDYEIFASSAFFMQSSSSILDMGDAKRKEMLERLLGIDKLNVWSEIAKEKVQSTQLNIDSFKKEIEILSQDMERYKENSENAVVKAREFDESKAKKISELQKEIDICDQKIGKIDKDAIKLASESWASIEIKKNDLKKFNDDLNLSKTDLSNKKHSLDLAKLQIESANDILSKIPSIDELDLMISLNEKFETKKTEIKNKRTERIKIEDLLRSLKEESKIIESEASKFESQALSLADSIKLIVDPQDDKCSTCQQSISKQETDRQKKQNSEKRTQIKLNALDTASKASKKRDELEEIKLKINNTEVKLQSNDWTEEKTNNEIALITPKVSNQEIKETKKTRSDKEQIIKDKTKEAKDIEKEIKDIEQKIIKEQEKINQISIQIEEEKPSISRDEIISMVKDIEGYTAKKKDKLAQKQKEEDSSNPFSQIVELENGKLKSTQEKIKISQNKVKSLINELNHYQYIQKAYGDRRKIKSIIISKLIPYFNQRIQYYLSSFNIDLDIKFTESLGFETKKWPFDLFSGGEQKRISVAIMFAMHDLWLAIYGRQCNIMALDEVDTALDESGASAFVNIINNDFAEKKKDRETPDTILVISHRNDMVDAFPRKIEVGRDEDRFSRLINIS